MKQLTVNIPDSFIPEFMEYFNRIPEASIVTESDFVITTQMLLILDESHGLPDDAYLSKEASNQELKEKHGL